MVETLGTERRSGAADTAESIDDSGGPVGRGGWRRWVPWRRRAVVAERDERSRRHDAPRRWPWYLAFALVGALLCGAAYVVFFSQLLALRTVSIVGAPDALSAKIRAAAVVSTGTPLARIDLDSVATEVETVSEVSSVEVARSWPHTLTITVTPRVPVAVTSANGRLWLLDGTGDPYLAVAAAPPGMVTVQLATPGVGDPPTVAALAVAAALTPDFKAKVAQITARTSFDVELTLTDGKKIIWGDASQSAQKMQVLPALLVAHTGTEYDVTDPTLVSVR